MEFENAVLSYVLAIFCLVASVIGIILTILFLVSGHLWPEGTVTFVVSLGLFGAYAYKYKKK